MKNLKLIIIILFFTSCGKGQIKNEIGQTDKLVYNKQYVNYIVRTQNAYAVQIYMNGLSIYPIWVSQGISYLDLGIENKGTQKLRVVMDLNYLTNKNYKPEPDYKVLTIELEEDTENGDDEILEDFELLYADLKEEDFKRGYYIKEIEFEAKPAYRFFKEDNYIDLKTQKNLLDSVYAQYELLVNDVNDRDAKAFVKRIETAEYQSSQLRNMEKDWVIKERERFFNNELKLFPKEECKLVFSDNGKMVSLGLKQNPFTNKQSTIIHFTPLGGTWEKGSFPKFISYYHNLFFAIGKGKNNLELLRMKTYTYDMDM